jgi:hypothetical protein
MMFSKMKRRYKAVDEERVVDCRSGEDGNNAYLSSFFLRSPLFFRLFGDGLHFSIPCMTSAEGRFARCHVSRVRAHEVFSGLPMFGNCDDRAVALVSAVSRKARVTSNGSQDPKVRLHERLQCCRMPRPRSSTSKA